MSKQTEKWKAEISNFEKSISEWEAMIEKHRHDLVHDSTIDFYEVQRKMKGAETLMKNVVAARKKIATLREKI